MDFTTLKTTMPTSNSLPYSCINGFAPRTFWDICNGQTSTVVIVKVKGTEEILGGYNPLALDANIDDSWGKPMIALFSH
ncbi:hypothetical protein Glove_271g39 [Diversispora epigaea]|uniref:TLDc domain-containing protein n=1 Tax=Diversispora epigaea TaxID=1348612 RepID=A0A397I9L3_9GLOM|nr:hypothetical protein Glove_271g39 [Diversispora epigaea]